MSNEKIEEECSVNEELPKKKGVGRLLERFGYGIAGRLLVALLFAPRELMVSFIVAITIFAGLTSALINKNKSSGFSDDVLTRVERLEYDVEGAGDLIYKLQDSFEALRKVISTAKIDEGNLREMLELSELISDLQSQVENISKQDFVGKMEAIEIAIQGDPKDVLAVPILRKEIDHLKAIVSQRKNDFENSLSDAKSNISVLYVMLFTLLTGLASSVFGPVLLRLYEKKTVTRDSITAGSPD